jgi:hypothetical protein
MSIEHTEDGVRFPVVVDIALMLEVPFERT